MRLEAVGGVETTRTPSPIAELATPPPARRRPVHPGTARSRRRDRHRAAARPRVSGRAPLRANARSTPSSRPRERAARGGGAQPERGGGGLPATPGARSSAARFRPPSDGTQERLRESLAAPAIDSGPPRRHRRTARGDRVPATRAGAVRRRPLARRDSRPVAAPPARSSLSRLNRDLLSLRSSARRGRLTHGRRRQSRTRRAGAFSRASPGQPPTLPARTVPGRQSRGGPAQGQRLRPFGVRLDSPRRPSREARRPPAEPA